MSQYLDMFNAAGRLSTLRDAEFVAMLQLLGRTGAVSPPCLLATVGRGGPSPDRRAHPAHETFRAGQGRWASLAGCCHPAA